MPAVLGDRGGRGNLNGATGCIIPQPQLTTLVEAHGHYRLGSRGVDYEEPLGIRDGICAVGDRDLSCRRCSRLRDRGAHSR